MRQDISNQGIERALARAVERSTPDIREKAASAPIVPLVVPDGIVPRQEERRRRAGWTRKAALAVCACLAVVLCLGLYSYFAPAAFIRIDVNPSLEIEANRYDRVLEVRPLNEEAEEVLGDMKLKHMDLDTAVNAIVGALVRQGWLDDGGTVTVWASGGSRDENLSIQRRIAGDIESLLDGRAQVVTPDDEEPEPVQSPAQAESPASPPAVSPAAPSIPPSAEPAISVPSPSAVPEDARVRAARNHISYGKQVFIDWLRERDPALDEAELAGMSLRALGALTEERGIDLRDLPDYDWEDSAEENIEEFVEEVNEKEEEWLEELEEALEGDD